MRLCLAAPPKKKKNTRDKKGHFIIGISVFPA
jgi:hypothetical protein